MPVDWALQTPGPCGPAAHTSERPLPVTGAQTAAGRPHTGVCGVCALADGLVLRCLPFPNRKGLNHRLPGGEGGRGADGVFPVVTGTQSPGATSRPTGLTITIVCVLGGGSALGLLVTACTVWREEDDLFGRGEFERLNSQLTLNRQWRNAGALYTATVGPGQGVGSLFGRLFCFVLSD